jgi:methyl-accepting chemotaxis protein
MRKLLEDQPALAKTDFGKRLDEVLQALAGSLLRQAAEQLAEKPLAAGEIDGEWYLQSLRFDQLVDEGTDEAAYLAHKEEMLNKIRESGKAVSLAALETARAKVRSVRHAQQELALEKQTHANQVTQQNLVIQSLDDKAPQLNEAADQARESYDQTQDKIQQVIDADQ